MQIQRICRPRSFWSSSIMTMLNALDGNDFYFFFSSKFYFFRIYFVYSGHLNDLENILPHTIVGFVYLMTNPPVLAAVNLFRVFGIARFVHTFVYVVKPMPQPARAISFFVSWLCTFYMCLKVIAFFGGAVPK